MRQRGCVKDASPFCDLEVPRSRGFDEIVVGEQVSVQRTLTAADIQRFSVRSGDVEPAGLDAAFAVATPFRDVVAYGMWADALISAVLETRLPGPGTVSLSQTLEFLAPVRIADTLTVTVSVTARDESEHGLTLHCECANAAGTVVISGVAIVRAPACSI